MATLTETKYLVETSYSTDALSNNVNIRLRLGWKLYGSISTCPFTDRGKSVIVFTQAVTKELNDETVSN